MRAEVENYFVMVAMSFMESVGCVFLMCAFAGIDIVSLGMGTVFGFTIGFTGLIFSVFVIQYFSKKGK